MISILIPVYNEAQYIRACLESIIQSDYPKSEMEIIVIDGGSGDETVQIVQAYQVKHPYIKILRNPKKIVPVSMNIGIKEAKGDYIVRLDAHAAYPKEYFSKLIVWHQKLDAANVGGVVITEVQHPSPKANAIKKVLSHPLGVGNSDFRVGVDEVKEVDTVPFGCYPREIFAKYGLYDERLVRNQDIELNKRIMNAGGKIYLIPEISCTYYARENFTALAKNNYANGKWNILTAYYTKTLNALSLRHFVPLLFLLSLLLPLCVSLIETNFLWIAALSLGSYLALVIIISFKLAEQSREICYILSAFIVLHVSYGIGSLMGIAEVCGDYIKGKKWKV